MIRLIILLFTRRWGLIIVGALLLIGGLIYGANSHSVSYQKVSEGTVAHFLSGGSSNTGYLQMSGSPTLYVLNENDFTPSINGINSFGDGDHVSFIYRTDGTTDIDQTSTIGTHLVGPAYTVVELTVFASNGQQVYNTSDYSKNPNGFYQNNWGLGGTLAFIGLLIVGLAFVLPSLLKKKQPAYNAAVPGSNLGMQGQPYQQPYQQPYPAPTGYEQYPPQQPGQYPQSPPPPQQAGQYPQSSYNQPYQPYGQAQPGQFDPTQVANPYNQPPQQ